MEISVCGGHRCLWSRLRCGSRWLLGCGIDDWVVGIGGWVVGFGDWVCGVGDWVVDIGDWVVGNSEWVVWVWVCGYGFDSGGSGAIVGF